MAGPRSRSSATDREASLGWVVGLFGYKGELRLFLHNRDSEFLNEEREVELVHPDGRRRTVQISTRGGAGGRILGRIRGLRDREEARELLDWEIIVPMDALPEPGEGEFYHHELLGLRVVTVGGDELGTITEIQSTGPVDVWVLNEGDDSEFIIATLEIVREVDLVEGVVTVEDEWNSTS